MFVVLRVRGTSKLNGDVSDTLKILGLHKPHQCTFVPNNPSYLGMLKKAEGCVAWGEVTPELLEKLIEVRGKSTDPKAKKVDAKAAAKKILEGKIKESGINPVLKLCPPKKGFARKGVLHGFGQGGELGYQKEKINELIERMI
ncbi:MAG: uL30 family ribosomal protein [Nanoarchaeota archaeon]|nr:uL30 family ribosomal protein [Nanoarchaeota archaeon]MBU4300764.1 uL30 family ribosomal protein [Nanoarchaeota archaeon]MBU4452368.1 uL30 family ribosomal protein [Nanoarchaeota archaeon]MCG2723356.1 uL30 family ribosomal protein [archaeon]